MLEIAQKSIDKFKDFGQTTSETIKKHTENGTPPSGGVKRVSLTYEKVVFYK